jgi:hypothetical protein
MLQLLPIDGLHDAEIIGRPAEKSVHMGNGICLDVLGNHLRQFPPHPMT